MLEEKPQMDVKEDFIINKHLIKPIIIDETKKINQLRDDNVNSLFHKVNRMGPYYSHCFSCALKNAEFYNIMDPDNALKILNHIKNEKKVRNALMY